MTSRTIEQIECIDKRRYRYNLLRAVGLVLFLGGVLVQSLVPASTPFWGGVISFFYGAGCGLTIVVSIAFTYLTGRIRRDPELDEALNNELFRHYTLRSALWGYYAMMGVGLVLGAITWLGKAAIPGEVCCLSILFAGVLAQTVALLVYDRLR